ncbi:hypothetical protein Avbf_14176 [Armadillidium vulgare]|nr:hypothetical protein Avbf_14176 [Armadillidium vulgare]
MDIKIEAEVKDEPFENPEEDHEINYHLKLVPELEESLEKNCFNSTEMKCEFKIKEESSYFEEENFANDEPFDEISSLDQNQVRRKCLKIITIVKMS